VKSEPVGDLDFAYLHDDRFARAEVKALGRPAIEVWYGATLSWNGSTWFVTCRLRRRIDVTVNAGQ